MNIHAREMPHASPVGAGATGRYDLPPPRDRLPTLPEDMSEYAWLNTGPRSWSDDASQAGDVGDLEERCLAFDGLTGDDDDDAASSEMDEVTAGLLVDLWHGDVPRVVAEHVTEIDEREAHVLSLMDGRSTVGDLLVTSVLSARDIVATLCELTARGLVTLERAPLRSK